MSLAGVLPKTRLETSCRIRDTAGGSKLTFGGIGRNSQDYCQRACGTTPKRQCNKHTNFGRDILGDPQSSPSAPHSTGTSMESPTCPGTSCCRTSSEVFMRLHGSLGRRALLTKSLEVVLCNQLVVLTESEQGSSVPTPASQNGPDQCGAEPPDINVEALQSDPRRSTGIVLGRPVMPTVSKD